jgi:hypothetical protein
VRRFTAITAVLLLLYIILKICEGGLFQTKTRKRRCMCRHAPQKRKRRLDSEQFSEKLFREILI